MFERDNFLVARGEGGGRSFRSRLGEDGERNGDKTLPITNFSSTIVIPDGLRACLFTDGGLEVEEPDRRDKLERPMSVSSSMMWRDIGECEVNG